MYDKKTEIKLAMNCGLSVKTITECNKKPKTIYSGTIGQWKDFNRLIRVLDEQFENEANVIIENR